MYDAQTLLQGKLVLLIESDVFLVGYIADGLNRAGAQILGPARSHYEANGLVSKLRTAPDAAVINVDIFEAASFTARDTLIRVKVPLLLIAGRPRVLMPASERHAVLTTPFGAYQVIDHLCTVMKDRSAFVSTSAGEPQLRGQ